MNNFLNEIQYESYYKSLDYETRSKIVWIFFATDKDQKLYLKDWKEWLEVQDYCRANKCNIDHVGLRYKGDFKAYPQFFATMTPEFQKMVTGTAREFNV